MPTDRLTMKRTPIALAIAISAQFLSGPGLAQDTHETGPVTRLEEVSILGDPSRVDEIPGSAHLLDESFLSRFEQADILRV